LPNVAEFFSIIDFLTKIIDNSVNHHRIAIAMGNFFCKIGDFLGTMFDATIGRLLSYFGGKSVEVPDPKTGLMFKSMFEENGDFEASASDRVTVVIGDDGKPKTADDGVIRKTKMPLNEQHVKINNKLKNEQYAKINNEFAKEDEKKGRLDAAARQYTAAGICFCKLGDFELASKCFLDAAQCMNSMISDTNSLKSSIKERCTIERRSAATHTYISADQMEQRQLATIYIEAGESFANVAKMGMLNGGRDPERYFNMAKDCFRKAIKCNGATNVHTQTAKSLIVVADAHLKSIAEKAAKCE
jgi:tetratricopeptide (TPR) repeat protein